MDSMGSFMRQAGLPVSRSRDTPAGFRLDRVHQAAFEPPARPDSRPAPPKHLRISARLSRLQVARGDPLTAFRHPSARGNVARSRPDRPPSMSLDAAPSLGLAAYLGRIAKMPRIHFYNRRSHHEHPSRTSLLETARRGAWETRRSPTSRSLARGVLPPPPRALPDHLAVIRPPTAARLTARSRLRVDRAPLLLALSRQRGRAPGALSAAGAPSIEPSDTSCGRPERGPRSRRDSSRLSTALPGHVNETGFCEARGAFHRRSPRRTLSRELAGERCRPLAGGGSRRTCSSRLGSFD